MKTTACAFAAFLLLLNILIPAVGFAQGDEDQSPVGKEMGAINRSFKTLNRQYADGTKKAASLELVESMLKNVENAKTLTPSKAEKAADQKKYMDIFHKDLDYLSKDLMALHEAISADKIDDAKALLDKIGKLKTSSHKELGIGGGRRSPGGPRPPASSVESPAPSASPSPAM